MLRVPFASSRATIHFLDLRPLTFVRISAELTLIPHRFNPVSMRHLTWSLSSLSFTALPTSIVTGHIRHVVIAHPAPIVIASVMPAPLCAATSFAGLFFQPFVAARGYLNPCPKLTI